VVDKQRLRAISAEAKRVDRAAAAAKREAAAHLVETRQEEVERRNDELLGTIEDLRGDLASSLASVTDFGFESLKIAPINSTFAPPPPPSRPPTEAREDPPRLFVPPPITGLAALAPGAKRRHEQLVHLALDDYQEAADRYEREERRIEATITQYEVELRQYEEDVVRLRAEFDRMTMAREEEARQHNATVDVLEKQFREGRAEAVVDLFSSLLNETIRPYEPMDGRRVVFSTQSRQLVIELELPGIDVVPDVREFRYVKARDEIVTSARPEKERRALYSSLIAQIALRTIYEAFRADGHGVVETIVFNGHVHAIDRRTGQNVHPCLVTVRTTRDRYGELNLGQVDPVDCLKGLSASISRSPAELVPVRPMIEFDMADPRFVKEAEVLATLDTRPNLMELTPQEFESLITNLFEKMGLETRLTQPSRDGGVDCVAFDTRPIFGGKVVIQAKRYKNTVGVSAVRDLYGTTQNEGATKGILVTTSGYGQASHDFANGKPLELIDGGQLLYLLQENAGVEAKIEVPEDWIDPQFNE
jgi:restriction system protein